MTFELTPEQEAVREFGTEKVRPVASTYNEENGIAKRSVSRRPSRDREALAG